MSKKEIVKQLVDKEIQRLETELNKEIEGLTTSEREQKRAEEILKAANLRVENYTKDIDIIKHEISELKGD